MSRKRALEEKDVQALRPRKRRYEVPDPGCKRLWLRVGSKGVIFVLIARLNGAANPTRLKLGVQGEMTLAEAREKAKRWNAWIDGGLDPQAEETRLEVERATRLRATFRCVLEDYLAYIPGRRNNRTAADDAKHLRSELLDPERNPWIDRAFAEVEDIDVAELIAAVRDRPARTSAYNLFRLVKKFFTWAHASARRRHYHLGPTSSIASLSATELELGPNVRDRVLDADELAAYVAAAVATPYPYGPFYMGMIRTGQRENEVAGMRRSELDMARRMWTIPKGRYKGKRAHVVPLSDQMMELLEALLRQLPAGHGDCLFSTDNGRTPISDFSGPVQAFKKAVLRELRAAKPGAEMEPWILEDTRRTMRTGLSRLQVPREVARAVVGHAKTGLDRIYDLYQHLPEREEALARWAEEIDDATGDARGRSAGAAKPARNARGRRR